MVELETDAFFIGEFRVLNQNLVCLSLIQRKYLIKLIYFQQKIYLFIHIFCRNGMLLEISEAFKISDFCPYDKSILNYKADLLLCVKV